MHLTATAIYLLNKVFNVGKKGPGLLRAAIKGTFNLLPGPVKQKAIRNHSLQNTYSKLTKIYKSAFPDRTPRVYVKKGIDRMEFFTILNERQVEYVLLRWWQNLPEIPAGEDMDILIKDEHRDLINDLVTFKESTSELKCDIYTISGVKHGCRRNIPYFQATLANTLINNRVFFRGAYVPSPKLYFASLVYHALFHKGSGSGLTGFEKKYIDLEHDYTNVLRDLANELEIQVDISAFGLYNWLKEEGFAPADDTLTKLVEHKPELTILERSLCSDVRGGELLVYVIRERLQQHGLVEDFKLFLEKKFLLDIIDVRILNATEKDTCRLQIRGGKWDKGPFTYSGGPPSALVVAYDYYPKPLNTSVQKKQIRMTNKNNIDSKYEYRSYVKNRFLLKGDYNGVHSADNELDAWSYISVVGEDYRKQIADEVERRRTRFARKWPLKKVLSESALAKTELISYKQGYAIQKTFRPGKERFFERELYAFKELSKEMDFIPQLLEEGNGYIIIPYLDNKLDTLPEKEAKSLLLSKREEITRVIKKMYAKGFAYINFTPKNIIITPENEFYCKDFEYLYPYMTPPHELDDTYEISGLPPGFDGDRPDDLTIEASSFNKVWSPYIGRWKRNASKYSHV